MGGLICRCLIQKVIPSEAKGPDGHAAGEVVARLFTYATPHGGIEFDVGFGFLEKARDAFGPSGADIFGPERMWEYLTGRIPDEAEGLGPEEMPDAAFPKDRIFTLIGTNPEDYDVPAGRLSAVVGPKSDGLVQIENAYVPGRASRSCTAATAAATAS